MTLLEPLFLTVDEVLELHDDQLRLFGGMAGVRDKAALESAAAMPCATFGGQFLHADTFEMAAAYSFHIAENQPFVDGNKRTALNATLVFLDLNGWTVQDPECRLYDGMLAIASHELNKQGLAELLRELACPRAPDEP